MAKKTHYVAYYSDFYWTTKGQSIYKDYTEDCKAMGEEPMEHCSWVSFQTEQDYDDFMENLKYVDFGDVTISGSVGLWYGREEIKPVTCSNLRDAIFKCIDDQDGFKVTVWKSKIEVESWNHDSQYHGSNRFVLKTAKKRESMFLY